MRDFVSSLVGNSANKGVLITTYRFSKDADDYARRIPRKVVLIDGVQLADVMMGRRRRHRRNTYAVKKLDLDYFGDE